MKILAGGNTHWKETGGMLWKGMNEETGGECVCQNNYFNSV